MLPLFVFAKGVAGARAGGVSVLFSDAVVTAGAGASWVDVSSSIASGMASSAVAGC